MEDQMFKKDIEVRFCDCDYKDRVKISTIMKYIADIAGVDYTEKGYSHQFLWDNGMVFLLSRVSIKTHENIKADQTITVSTFEKGVRGPVFYRDFWIEEGERKLVSAKSTWILCNPHTRKILRPSEFPRSLPDNFDIMVDCEETQKLKEPEDIIKVGNRKIVYSDIDSNNHVYNAVYGDIVCDFLPNSLLSEYDPSEFQINFSNEIKLGQTIDINCKVEEKQAFVTGTDSEATYFKAKIKFK